MNPSIADEAARAAVLAVWLVLLRLVGYRPSGGVYRSAKDLHHHIKLTESRKHGHPALVAFENPNNGSHGRPLDAPQFLVENMGLSYPEAIRQVLELAERLREQREKAAGEKQEAGRPSGIQPTARLRKLATSMGVAGLPIDTALAAERLDVLNNQEKVHRALIARRLHVPAVEVLHPKNRKRAERLAPADLALLDAVVSDVRAVQQLLQSSINGRIHPRWSPGHTRTGRWTVEPCIQSLPTRHRDLVGTPDGRLLVGGDLSAADPLVAGFLSGALHLQWAASLDFHELTAKSLFSLTTPPSAAERAAAKLVTMKSLYGASEASLGEQLKAHGLSASAYELQCEWEYLNRPYVTWRKRLFRRAQRGGALLTGYRHRKIPYSTTELTHEGQTAAWVVQSTVTAIFDQMLLALAARLDGVRRRAVIIAMLHDSVLVECDERDGKRIESMVRAALTKPYVVRGRHLAFRVKSTTGRHWGEL